ncbi:MAG: RecX family transcriptional regulator [Elusimicrobia bacterium]|nr:RecX family transcriptional regulator [Elusimicrobiota bacterium]
MTGDPPPAGRRRATAYAVALRLLTLRALTTEELAGRLLRRAYPPAEVEEAVGRCAQLGYLDDRRTAAAWASSAAHARGLGPRRVREGLARRGLGRETAAAVAAELFPPGEEARFAAAALERRERARGPADVPEERRRAYLFLRRRGFSSAASRAALFNRPENG